MNNQEMVPQPQPPQFDFPALIATVNDFIEKATGNKMPFALVIHSPPGSMIAGNVPEVAIAKILELGFQGLTSKIGREAINRAAAEAMAPQNQERPKGPEGNQ
jgi:hypothetical protein